MTWQDWLAIFGFVAGLLGVPNSYAAIRAIWKDFFAIPDSAAKLTAEISAAFSSTRAGDRVLLDFKKERAGILGTFENAVYKFAEACPLEEDKQFIIQNPFGVLRANAVMYFQMRMFGIASFGGFAFLWLVLLVVPGPNVTSRSFFESIGLFVAQVGFSAFFLSTGYLTIRRSNLLKRGHDAAQAYLNYLRQHEISIGTEFTQSKKAFDQRQSTTSA